MKHQPIPTHALGFQNFVKVHISEQLTNGLKVVLMDLNSALHYEDLMHCFMPQAAC